MCQLIAIKHCKQMPNFTNLSNIINATELAKLLLLNKRCRFKTVLFDTIPETDIITIFLIVISFVFDAENTRLPSNCKWNVNLSHFHINNIIL